MAQSLAQLYAHIVFSTKDHHPFIQPSVEKELFSYMGKVIKHMKGYPFLINGTSNHIHIFTNLPRTISLSKFLEEIKKTSSKWIKTKGSQYQKFAWQNGYAGFSVSSSNKDRVIKYIANQKEHHRKQSFKEELLAFLKEYGIEYDERYLWD